MSTQVLFDILTIVAPLLIYGSAAAAIGVIAVECSDYWDRAIAALLYRAPDADRLPAPDPEPRRTPAILPMEEPAPSGALRIMATAALFTLGCAALCLALVWTSR